MATCKDCFHFEVCDSGRHIGEYEIDDGVYTEGVEKECSAFRDKADFVEVIRCKDCDVPHNKWLGCPHLNGLIPPPDFYCAKGTPKERGVNKNDE